MRRGLRLAVDVTEALGRQTLLGVLGVSEKRFRGLKRFQFVCTDIFCGNVFRGQKVLKTGFGKVQQTKAVFRYVLTPRNVSSASHRVGEAAYKLLRRRNVVPHENVVVSMLRRKQLRRKQTAFWVSCVFAFLCCEFEF